MKKILFIMCAVAGVFSMASCGSQKKVAERNDMTEINIPLGGPQYKTDKEYYRAVQSGESINEAMARKIAVQNARQELAASIKADIDGIVENFGKEQAIDTLGAYKAQYGELFYTRVKETLVGATVLDEKLFKTNDGKYKYYVCLQMAKADVQKKIEETISADEKLKLEFELDQFRKIYNSQLENFKAEN